MGDLSKKLRKDFFVIKTLEIHQRKNQRNKNRFLIHAISKHKLKLKKRISK